MSQQELLARVIAVLDAAGIDYMVTGSITSSLQGEPRSTHDIDIVVALVPLAVDLLTKAFPAPDYYLDASAIREAIRTHGMVNLLDIRGGDKVDFWMLKDDEFDRSRFARKFQVAAAGLRLNVSRPEDTILSKLQWSELSGGSEKQFKDAQRVYEVQFPTLDLKYMEAWATRLNLTALWTRLKDEAKVIDPRNT